MALWKEGDDAGEHQKRKIDTKGAEKNIDRFVLFAFLPLCFLCSQDPNLTIGQSVGVIGLRIICSGNLIRYPLGGFSWHHLQYLVGFAQMGHEVTYVEDYGWGDSCYDPARGDMTSDPRYGIAYLIKLLQQYDSYGLDKRWCYLAEDGVAHGLSRQ